MPARVERVRGRAGVDVEGGLDAHAHADHRAGRQAHRAAPHARLAALRAPRVLPWKTYHSPIHIFLWITQI